MDRLLAGSGGTISLSSYDSSGALADVDGTNAPTVVVRDSAGVSVLTPTGVRDSTGAYHAVIPVTQTSLDVYGVTWTWGSGATRTSAYEIVGSHLFTIAALRAFDQAFANTVAYPSALIRDVRETVEDRFWAAGRVSFTLRGFRDRLSGKGTDSVFTTERQVNSIVSLTVSGSVLDAGSYTFYDQGKVQLLGSLYPAGANNVSVFYRAGWYPTPSPVVDAALRYARNLLVKGPFDELDRATGMQTEAGVWFRIQQAGPGGRIGIPDIDAVISEFGRRAPASA